MSAPKPVIRYMRYPDGRPWGCIYLLDADHIGWTVHNPCDRLNKKLARDGGDVPCKGKQRMYTAYHVYGAKERALTADCSAYIDETPRRVYPPGQWRRRAIEREVFLMRAWAQAREVKT